MIRIVTLFLTFLWVALQYGYGQVGRLIEGQSVESTILPQPVNYSIYLPPDYEISQRSYPIVYLLHGYTDDETAWVQFGEVDRLATDAILQGIIPPMIIAMPDAGVSWYINNHDESVRYEDFFIDEFIPHIETTYRVRAQKQFRGVAGLSMGGYGSLIYALKHPDLFTAAAPLSAAIYTEEEVVNVSQQRWNRTEGVLYGTDLSGEDRITDHWKANNPFYILESSEIEPLREIAYYFDCGDDDFLFRGNVMFMLSLREKDISHEFRVREGAHNWTYWRTGIVDALAFIGDRFHR